MADQRIPTLLVDEYDDAMHARPEHSILRPGVRGRANTTTHTTTTAPPTIVCCDGHESPLLNPITASVLAQRRQKSHSNPAQVAKATAERVAKLQSSGGSTGKRTPHASTSSLAAPQTAGEPKPIKATQTETGWEVEL